MNFYWGKEDRSGASCPDAIVEAVLQKIVSFFESSKSINEVMESLKIKNGC